MGILSPINVILGIIFAVVAYFVTYGIDDGQKFCATSAHRDQKNPPRFVYENGKHVNKGGKACIEDIVGYSNDYRAGADHLVGTEDDVLDTKGHFELAEKLLKQEFPGGWWIPNGRWHFNHNAAVLGQMKMLYADGNEYVLIFGNPTPSSGYSGQYPYDCHDFQMEGEQINFLVGNLTNRVYTPNYRSTPGSKGFAMVLPRGTQKGYAQKGGGWMMEYGYGNLVPALYDGVIMPTLFITNDWRSFCVSMGDWTRGFIYNTLSKVVPVQSLGAILGGLSVQKS